MTSNRVNVEPDCPIIVVTGGGIAPTYVRWYPDLWAAERNHVMMTVTFEGISIHTRYLEEIPKSWLDQAKGIKGVLIDNPCADLGRMATHKHSVVSNGPLVPVNGNA